MQRHIVLTLTCYQLTGRDSEANKKRGYARAVDVLKSLVSLLYMIVHRRLLLVLLSIIALNQFHYIKIVD